MVKKPKLKNSSSSQLLSKDFPKLFSECAMFIRDRRNTNLTKNIVMAAPVTMNSTLDNAGVLDPLLKFIFKNWDITQFIILLILKKLPPIIIYFYNFLVFLFLPCYSDFLSFHTYVFKFSFISSFVFTSHSHLRHFQ